MDGELEEQDRPKFEIVTPAGRSRSSREYTGPGISTYVLEEDGGTERFFGEYAGGIRQGAGKTDNSPPCTLVVNCKPGQYMYMRQNASLL